MATVTLYHDTRSGKDTFPIKLRIAHKKEKAYISLGIKVTPEEWDAETGQVLFQKNGNKNKNAIDTAQ